MNESITVDENSLRDREERLELNCQVLLGENTECFKITPETKVFCF